MPTIYIHGQALTLDPKKAIGKGGEADIFEVGGEAVKVYKPPNHPDYQGQPLEQAGAKERLEIHQRKLPAFPQGLPDRVVTPIALAYERTGQRIVGYSMRLVRGAEVLMRYAQRQFRQAGVPNETVMAIFRDLHQTVQGIHQQQVVAGDFNDLNVLVKGTEGYLVDADSFQFGEWPCRVFTARFVDPLLCNQQSSSPMLVKPHTMQSDWYAFAVMLMQCLLFVDPYGGIYIPKDPRHRLPHPARPLHRITIFNPEVRYPKPAIPYTVLPDDLLHFFHQLFEKDERGEFPVKLLEMRWTTCTTCQTEHARNTCPNCQTAAPIAIKEVTTIRGSVIATRVFTTPGLIVFAAAQQGKLHYLYHEDGAFRREGGTVVVNGPLDPLMRFRIRGETTLIGKERTLVALTPGKTTERREVDCLGTLPVFDANAISMYWLENGRLQKEGMWAPQYIGSVLRGQTLFWVGQTFGFGFYRAGQLNIAFVFDAQSPGINDSVQLPPIRGQLVDSTCVFTAERCWFFLATRTGGKTIHQCRVIQPNGVVEATAEAEQGDGSWLGTLRGKCAAGKGVLTATDEGIVRVEVDNGQISRTREFPDSEPFVQEGDHLFPGQGGIYVVSARAISLLKIS